MLDEIEKIAQIYIPKEEHNLSKITNTHIVALFKINSCFVRMDVLVSLLYFIMGANYFARVRITNGFLHAYFTLDEYYDYKSISSITKYETSEFKVDMQFCKFKFITPERFTTIPWTIKWDELIKID